MTFTNRVVFRAAALMFVGATLSSISSVPAYSATVSKASPSTSIPLSNVTHPEAALKDAKIYDQKGVIIGFVDKVILDAGGKAAELRVDVGNYLGMDTKMVAMMAGDFKFDTSHKTLTTNLTNAQIQVIAGGH